MPSGDRKARGRGLSVIDLWRLLDNLRRSVLPLASLLFLAAAWLALPGSMLFWTLAVLAASAVPALLGALTPFVAGDTSPWGTATRSMAEGLARWLLAVAFLPFEALQLASAIALTLYRGARLPSRSAEVDDSRGDRTAVGKRKRPVHRVASHAAARLRSRRYSDSWSPSRQPGRFPVALPLLIAWLLAPEVAYRISLRSVLEPEPLTPDQERELWGYARRTWLFFEHFVGPEDHWLPPDHFQEAPRGVATPYTSPTNIGMLLLSTLAAYDLGYVGFPVVAARLQYTFETLSQLERHRGHFLNWYDTRSLDPLPPRFISTVDSGNLAASLIVIKQALGEIPDGRIMRWVRWEGLVHTYTLLDPAIEALAGAGLEEAETLRRAIAQSQERVLAVRDRPDAWWDALEYAAGEGWQQVEAVLTQVIVEHGAEFGAARLRNLRLGIEAIRQQFFTLRRFINLLLPWLPMLANAPALCEDAGLPAVAELYAELRATFDTNPSLAEQPEICRQGGEAVSRLQDAVHTVGGRDADVAAAQGLVRRLEVEPGRGPRRGRADPRDFGRPRDPGRRLLHRHGLRLPVRAAAAGVPHRLQRYGRQAGRQLLRFAGLRSAHRQPGGAGEA